MAAASDLSSIDNNDLFFQNPEKQWIDGPSEFIELTPSDYDQHIDLGNGDGYSNNDTLDIMELPKSTINTIFPISPCGPPDRACFPGEYNFHVEINSADTHKKKYLYSSKLGRLYVDAGCDFPIYFMWSGVATGLAVRACVIFLDQDQAEKRVETCPNHDLAKRDPNHIVTPEFTKKWKNVLHSSRNDDTDGVYYCGDKNSWYSTVVTFDNKTEKRSHAYRFVCKNSCPMGINRRSLAIIFTLEDYKGTVYGREMVNVRVCACPRRDLHKDEEAAHGHHRARTRDPQDPPGPPRTKKIKTEPVDPTDDDKIVEVPAFKVRGVAATIMGLETMKNMMELYRRKTTDPHNAAQTDQCISDVKNVINKIKNTSQTQPTQ
ncbi:cellular tumor antigen p53-like [Achroia grisella]|uniref:cellular tumor antigen p53-like n=1 Tax=Achroia grisella TaxID=688607 RepID=UPI0027D25B30|nr:cellular tumor antigen p53-like [Achroia grisella]XP_059062368.1 cellular tumor antigen p53-like [Achroia grisella]